MPCWPATWKEALSRQLGLESRSILHGAGRQDSGGGLRGRDGGLGVGGSRYSVRVKSEAFRADPLF
ncbi:MAG: hypothetical protein LBJ02_00075, partial [Bifidobacteriaceae bacterium]|nr:hypothetical protein [Bifidobacteriaceae bacterium]